MSFSRIDLGHGVGLRTRHFGPLLERETPVDWVEATSENFFAPGGRPLAVLEKVRREVPVVLHGVSLGIGSVDRLDSAYLDQLATLAARIEPAYVSDHLCWGTHGGRYTHELLPLPYTEEALKHVAARTREVQDRLGRQILLENVSSYVGFQESHLSEWEFLAGVAERADCGILLDINNIYVSARNHGFDAGAYLRGIPAARVGYLHLAGHSDKGRYLLDTHDASIPEAVWSLYADAVERFGAVPTLVEWDDQIPELDALVAESRKAAALEARTLACRTASVARSA